MQYKWPQGSEEAGCDMDCLEDAWEVAHELCSQRGQDLDRKKGTGYMPHWGTF